MGSPTAALIPAFNAATSLGQVVEGTRRYVREVLVVDDGSTDQTSTVARYAGARVIRLAVNSGKGTAVRTGLGLLLGEHYERILMLDADGQHDPNDIPRFLAVASHADFVLGNRLWSPAGIPARRRWTNHIGTTALRLMTGFPLEDSQCGFRLVSAGLLRRMGLVGRRYSVDTEILVRAGKLRATFHHVPVRVIYGGEVSHYRPALDTLHILFSAVRFKADEGDLRRDPGAEEWRRKCAAPMEVLPANTADRAG